MSPVVREERITAHSTQTSLDRIKGITQSSDKSQNGGRGISQAYRKLDGHRLLICEEWAKDIYLDCVFKGDQRRHWTQPLQGTRDRVHRRRGRDDGASPPENDPLIRQMTSPAPNSERLGRTRAVAHQAAGTTSAEE